MEVLLLTFLRLSPEGSNPLSQQSRVSGRRLRVHAARKQQLLFCFVLFFVKSELQFQKHTCHCRSLLCGLFSAVGDLHLWILLRSWYPPSSKGMPPKASPCPLGPGNCSHCLLPGRPSELGLCGWTGACTLLSYLLQLSSSPPPQPEKVRRNEQGSLIHPQRMRLQSHQM